MAKVTQAHSTYDTVVKFRSRVISHAQYSGGKRYLARGFAGNDGAGAVGSAEADKTDKRENSCRSAGYCLEEACEKLGQIHEPNYGLPQG